MLHVSTHVGLLEQATHLNRLDWMDIGYERLDAAADYKIVLFRYGEGGQRPVYLRDYPRWSMSIWDLVARAAALTTSPNLDQPQEAVHPVETSPKRRAFAQAISVLVEHGPSKGMPGRRIAAMQIVQAGRRGLYRARVEEDLWRSLTTAPFTFAPTRLQPVDLLLRAAVTRITGSPDVMPPRPALRLPAVVTHEGKPYVAIDRLEEPARTGFVRWLHRNSEAPLQLPNLRGGLAAPETMFTKFLRVAV
jgi:hypothetical protein